MTDGPLKVSTTRRREAPRSFVSPCGDTLERDGDVLVIRAALPIEELKRPIYRLRTLVEAGMFEPEGKVLVDDGERHRERRRERVRTALAWFLWIPTVPLLPVVGLLPETWKERLVELGVDPGRASRLSLALEWLLIAACLIVYPFVVFTLPGVLVGGLALFTAADIAYRVAADLDNRSPGAFALEGAIAAWVKELTSKDTTRELLDDDERSRLLSERPRYDRDVKPTDDRPPVADADARAADARDAAAPPTTHEP